MKVKIFQNWEKGLMQEEINEWLTENSNFVIQNVLQSTGSSGGGRIYTIITIFHSEMEFQKVK